MAFERPSINTIYTRMKADAETRVTGNVKIPDFSFFDILLRVFSGSIHLCYGMLTFLARQLFPDTANEAYLERIGRKHNIPRKAPTYATGTILLVKEDVGSPNTLVPTGTKLQSDAGIKYTTTEDGTTGVDVFVNVVCDISGTVGNLDNSNALTYIELIPNVAPIAPIFSDIAGGTNLEDLEDYRKRIEDYFSNRPAGGRKSDYEAWALEVSGVGQAWAFDSYMGAGTVGIVIADGDSNAVSGAVKTNCQNNINAKGPLGVRKDVIDVIPVPTEFLIAISPNTSEYRLRIEENIKNFFLEEAEPTGTLLISQIYNILSNSGINDYLILAMSYDGVGIPIGNITAANYDLPYLDTITFFTLG